MAESDNLDAGLVLDKEDVRTMAIPRREEEDHYGAGDHQSFHCIEAGTSVGSSHRLLLEVVVDSFVPLKSQRPVDSVARILQNYDCVRSNSNSVLHPVRPALEPETNLRHAAGRRRWNDVPVVQNEAEDSSRFVVEDKRVEVRCSIQL